MTTQPRRIVQVVGRLMRGGAEVWLMRVLRKIDRIRFRFTFVTLSPKPGEFDDELRILGADIYRAPTLPNRVGFARWFREMLRDVQPEVVHGHMLFASGAVLQVAQQAGVPIRVAHSHNTSDGQPNTLLRMAYRARMRAKLRRYCTHGIGCSAEAADWLFGSHWKRSDKYYVLPCGVDTDEFADLAGRVDRARLCAELGIPPERRIIGHVGRFMYQKNHAYLLRIFRALLDAGVDAHLVLVGAGELQAETEALAQRLGLTERTTFTGVRLDVQQMLLTLFDIFVLPSYFEGLPVVALEAQCAAVPVLMSDVVSRETVVIPELAYWQSLRQPPTVWAQQIVQILGQPRLDSAAAQRRVECSRYSIASSVQLLTEIYGTTTQ